VPLLHQWLNCFVAFVVCCVGEEVNGIQSQRMFLKVIVVILVLDLEVLAPNSQTFRKSGS